MLRPLPRHARLRFEFTHIAGPVIIAQRTQSFVGEPNDRRPVVVASATFDEKLGQFRNVGFAFTQRWHFNVDDIEAIEQVLAETAFGHVVGKIAIGGSDDADVDPNGLTAANPFELVLLQKPQQLDLNRW